MMKVKSIFPFLIAVLLIISSCDVLHIMQEIQQDNIEVSTFYNNDKVVHFIGVHHIGKAHYYENLKENIIALKQRGYVVFYERLQDSPGLSLAEQDSLLRKMRRMIGMMPNTEIYAAFGSSIGLRNMVAQPENHDLGMDLNDVNVDISVADFVQVYENRFGEIELSDRDFAIALDSLEFVPPVPVENRDYVMIHYRDKYLARAVHFSPLKHIVVVYGRAHLEGFYKNLRQLNAQWNKL